MDSQNHQALISENVVIVESRDRSETVTNNGNEEGVVEIVENSAPIERILHTSSNQNSLNVVNQDQAVIFTHRTVSPSLYNLRVPLNDYVPVNENHEERPQPSQNLIQHISDREEEVPNASNRAVDIPSTSSQKKRKRTSSGTPLQPSELPAYTDEYDDGMTCPICLEEWEMTGLHRITSLKCGHVFGQSCIKRWLQDCSPGNRCCPSCKSRAALRDLRFIYAKRVCAVDKTQEYQLKENLEKKINELAQLKVDYAISQVELNSVRNRIIELERELENLKHPQGQSSSNYQDKCIKLNQATFSYKLFLEKQVVVSNEAGCRVMLHAQNSRMLMVSQKTNQNIFPGYGVKFFCTHTFKSSNFLHMSSRSIRDLSLSPCENLLISATQEKTTKLYHILDKTVIQTFTPSEKAIWSCAIEQDVGKYLYLGNQTGSAYLYDIRHSENILKEFKVETDLSPVINICPIPASDNFKFGGVLICKLQSIWFYEFTSSSLLTCESTKLNVDGPFISMSYDITSNNILISTRPNLNNRFSRYIMGNLTKFREITMLTVTAEYVGSNGAAVMARCSQINIDDVTFIAAYLQDLKVLAVWDVKKNKRIQSISVKDLIYDTCPIYTDYNNYLAALSETKFRLYKING